MDVILSKTLSVWSLRPPLLRGSSHVRSEAFEPGWWPPAPLQPGVSSQHRASDLPRDSLCGLRQSPRLPVRYLLCAPFPQTLSIPPPQPFLSPSGFVTATAFMTFWRSKHPGGQNGGPLCSLPYPLRQGSARRTEDAQRICVEWTNE